MIVSNDQPQHSLFEASLEPLPGENEFESLVP